MCSITFTYAFIWYQSTTALDEVVYLSMLVTSLSFVLNFILKIFLPCFFLVSTFAVSEVPFC